MCLGALVDAGVPLREIERGLRHLPLRGYELTAKRVKRNSIAATKVDVLLKGPERKTHQHRRWKDIKESVEGSSLPQRIRQRGMKIFRALFEAEGRVHGTPHNKTFLHELGAVDCIVDVFGTLIGLDALEVDDVYSSAVNLGGGSITTEHGRLPVPGPATAEILKDVPVYSSEIPFELTTPTGAAILKGITDGFVSMPVMNIRHIGYGAGERDIKGFPNTLRILVGDRILPHDLEHLPRVTVIETNIDDMNPQLYEYVMERLFEAGALDVYLTQVIMKKGRPAVVLTVLCDKEKRTDMVAILLRETTTVGVRFHDVSRCVLERTVREVKTQFGKIRFKVSRTVDGTERFSPEYEDCKRAAKKDQISLREVLTKLTCLKHK